MFKDNGFFPYIIHTQAIEDIINTCVNQYFAGNTEFTIENVSEELSDSDLEYIKEEIKRRIG